MTGKTMAIQAIRMVQALNETRSFDTEEIAGATHLATYLALSCGFTKEQIYKLRSLSMNETEAVNLTEIFDRTWDHCFKG